MFVLFPRLACLVHDKHIVQLISAVFDHSMLRVREIYALENTAFYIAFYIRMGHIQTINFLFIYATQNVQMHLKSTV